MIKDMRSAILNSVQDDPGSGKFRRSRDIFSDQEIFDLEMRSIFEGNWVYQRVLDGSVQLSDSDVPADIRQQDRSNHLLYRAGRRVSGVRCPPDTAV